ncbi:hypothetical protein QEH53_00760 [Pelagicoccus sp. SDUM812002]|nr:hypothetical protein [Pelagicoccus sp. SDUM812002]
MAETEIAKAISGPVDLEEEGFEFESLGPGSSYCRDGTEIRTKEQAKEWRNEKMTTFDHYYALDKHGRWKRRKRSGGVLKKQAATLFPEHDYILRALDSLGVDISPLTRKLADKVTDAFDRIDPNENVILTSIHPNAGCLHIDLITTRFCRPTPELNKITLKNQNTRQGNNRSAHAGPALIALLRLRERGVWPDELSKDLDKFLRKRERATERLPTDYLVCDIVDRFLEEELPKLHKGIPHLEKAVEKAKADYKQHIELVAAKRLHEFKVAKGDIAPDETLEKLREEKARKEEELKEAQKYLQDSEKALHDQKGKLETLKSESTKLHQETQEIEKQLTKTKNSNETLSNTISDKQKETLKLESEVETLERKTADIKIKFRELRTLGENLIRRFKRLQDFCRTINDTITLQEEVSNSTQQALGAHRKDSKASNPLFESLYGHLVQYIKKNTAGTLKTLEEKSKPLEKQIRDFESEAKPSLPQESERERKEI